MAAEVDLVNAALRDVGAKAIATISDTTTSGGIAGDVYSFKRDALLRAHTWNFAMTRRRLARLTVTPKFRFDYAYGLPSDWMRTVSVHASDDGRDTIPYKQEAIFTAERISNGAFTTDLTSWSGTNWAYSSGKALHTAGSTAALTQTATLTASGLFLVEFEISGMSAGTLQPTFSGGTGVTGTAVSADGFYAEELTAHSGGNTSFNLVPTSAFNGAVDNVSVVRLDGDDTAANAIFSDQSEVWLRYVRKVTDVDLMTAGFQQGLIFLMQKTFATGLASSNALRQLSDEDLKQALRIARSVDGIEDFPEQFPQGSWVATRNGGRNGGRNDWFGF